MDVLEAIQIIEGDNVDNEQDLERRIEAFQFLINTGIVWELQGSYGRAAAALIQRGICTLPSTTMPSPGRAREKAREKTRRAQR